MTDIDINFIIKVLANNPPSILIVVGAVLIIYGSATGDTILVNYGWTAIKAGVFLQFLWLLGRFGIIRAVIDALS